MALDVYCLCLRCSRKPLLLRKINPKLAKKHLRHYGPGPEATGQAAAPASSSGHPNDGTALGDISNYPSTSPEDYLDSDDRIGLDGREDHMDVDPETNPVFERRPQATRISAAGLDVALPSDTVYREVDFPDTSDLSQEPDDSATTVPRAYSENEPPCVRIAYLQAVINNVVGNMPVKQTTDNLNWTLNALDAAGAVPAHPRPVRTLISAKRRLGIDPDQWIVQYAICPQCWKHHSPKELLELITPRCSVSECSGIIFTVEKDKKGQPKRVPIKIIPHVSLLHWIRRMVRRKGFRRLLRDSRNTPRNQNEDENFLMTDMHDGQVWHELRTGIKREIGNYGTVRDTAVGDGMERNLTDFRFGLHLVVNIDWCVIFSFIPLRISLVLLQVWHP